MGKLNKERPFLSKEQTNIQVSSKRHTYRERERENTYADMKTSSNADRKTRFVRKQEKPSVVPWKGWKVSASEYENS